MTGSAQGRGFGGTRLGTRWLLVSVLGVAACGLALAVWLDARRERVARHPKIEGELSVEGLSAPLRILRDRSGVPHIRADSDPDAWFGLGFVHAQDRAGQMLSARRAALGTAAAHEGAQALPADRWARTLGFGRLAAAEEARLGAAERRVLVAYAAGANAWLDRIRSGAVGAPAGVRVGPELPPWTPADSLAVLKHRAWTLGASLEESLTLEELIRRIGPALARSFFPPAVRSASRPDGSAPRIATPDGSAPRIPGRTPGWRDPLRLAAGHAGRSVGSSAVLIQGSQIPGEAPLLAGDSHYPALAPAELHQADLRGDRLSVAGVAVPGAPVFWSGFNRDVAWAATHVPAVVTDLVVETLHADREARVFDARGWRPVELREERIEVRGAGAETLRVRTTPRGPLVHELLGSPVPMSVRWMGAQGGSPIRGFLRLAGSERAEEAAEALAHHHEPILAVLVADAQGGFRQLAGALPDRDLSSGLVPLPSGNRGYDWRGRIPAENLPRRALGRRGVWLIAADASLGRVGGGPEMLWRSGARHARWEHGLRALRARGRIDEADLLELQDDATSDVAGALVERALGIARRDPPRSREAREVVSLLEGWSGEMTAERAQAAAYQVFVGRLVRHLFEPELGEPLLRRLLGLRGLEPTWLLSLALEDASGSKAPPWARPERIAQAVQRSLRETWIELSVTLGPNRKKWGWGRLHPLQFRPRRDVGWRANPQLGPFPFGGDGTTLRLGEYQPLESYEAQVVAVHRWVVDVSDLDQALVFLTPGQTEQPGHRWEADGVARWLEGRPSLLSTRDPVVADALVAELRLEPAP